MVEWQGVQPMEASRTWNSQFMASKAFSSLLDYTLSQHNTETLVDTIPRELSCSLNYILKQVKSKHIKVSTNSSCENLFDWVFSGFIWYEAMWRMSSVTGRMFLNDRSPGWTLSDIDWPGLSWLNAPLIWLPEWPQVSVELLAVWFDIISKGITRLF